VQVVAISENEVRRTRPEESRHVRVVAIVQSRYGSARLPGKAMLPIAGRPMLAHVLERAIAIGVDDVVLATTRLDRDRPLTWIADDLGVESYCGDETDVLDRYVGAATMMRAGVVVRLTGDCPLLAPDVCREVISLHEVNPACFASNDTAMSGFPDGTDCEVFSVPMLLAAQLAVRAHARWVHGDCEHVTTWMRRHAATVVLRSLEDWRHVKLSVDCADDLDHVRRVYARLPAGDFSIHATLDAAKQEGLWHAHS